MFRNFIVLVVVLFSTTLSAKTIVVLGDSISASYGIETSKGWVSLLEQKINQPNKRFKVFNESISGDTSAGGLARIDKILSQYKPDVLLLELGANDGLRGLSVKGMQNNLAEIIQRAKGSGSKVLLLSMRIPPNYGKRYVDMFYNVYPKLAKQLNIPFVPFILDDVALVNELMQKDGLHPNSKAQPLIVKKIWPYLKPILGI